MEAKRPLNGTSKVNRQTDRQTDGQTHRRTNRLIESIGPEGRCFENLLVGCLIFDVHFAMCDVACVMHKGYTVQMELFGRPN